jgi:uncharacterized protein (TIGR00730 family)
MRRVIESVGVFCGAKMGTSDIYCKEVQDFVTILCELGLTIVYGGGNVGLMGAIADQAIKNKGKIIGVMPRKLVDIECAHTGLTELHIVNTMDERKALIAELSDMFVMLPGGTGSLDEFFEMFTLLQLGYQNKPCAILNMNHYYDHLIHFLDHATQEGFLLKNQRDMILTTKNPLELLECVGVKPGSLTNSE